MQSFIDGLAKIFELLANLLRKSPAPKNQDLIPTPTPNVIPTPVEPPPIVSRVEPITENDAPHASNASILICPVQSTDVAGKPLTSRTIKVSGVIDHSDTAIDPTSQKRWGVNAKDQKVKSFNGEIGDGEPSADKPYGYTKQVPAPFFSAGEINYVGAHASGDKYAATYYLNYDGHAGYDFPYPRMTPIIAPADGYLQKATNAEDLAYGQGWDIHHTFYIKHSNGFSTWFRHCTKLADDIESQVPDHTKSCFVKREQVIAYVGDFGARGAVHLHLEVRDTQGKIIDPYADGLWIA